MLSGRRIKLFKLLGFQVQIEWTWLFLAAWMTWSLASDVFPANLPGLEPSSYWWMGSAGALGLFASIVFHELWHSLVARHYGIAIEGITLFIFGGVAELKEEPPSAKTEFLMALAGPASSALLGVAILGAREVIRMASGGVEIAAVLRYLASINLSLAAFNLLPAFPLDGGRMLRAAVWRWRRDLRWATQLAAWIGTLLGNLLLAVGTIVLFLGSLVNGVWMIVVGLYLRSVSRQSYRQLSIRLALAGERVESFLIPDPVTVAPDLPLAELVEEYVYKHHQKTFPVVDGLRLVGCVHARALETVPQSQWTQRRVIDLTQTCDREDMISGGVDAMQALTQMSRAGRGRLMVVDGDRLVGVITLQDLLEFLALRLGRQPGIRWG
ncbi:MAG TPA: site-2 protease family protein [Anaerolineae bacterium]|nr:site-2 protease family protein [Anaerolineae bacterium]